MSTPLDRPFDRDLPSLYAPRWARLSVPDPAEAAQPPAEDRSFDDGEAGWESPHQVDGGPPRGLTIERFRVPRSLEPTVLPEPGPEPGGPSMFGMWVRLGAAIATAAVVALFVAARLPSGAPAVRVAEAAPAPTPAPARSAVTPVLAVEQPTPAPASLVVVTSTPHLADDPNPLGISAHDAAGAGAVVIVTGLPAGASITTGRPLGANAWRLSTVELGNAKVRPPRGFVGAIELIAELRRADDAVADRRMLRLEWIGAAKPPEAPAARRLDPGEIASLIKRGEEYVAHGDLSAARLLLQRAAEAQDAHAALALAATYDPVVLARLGVRGLTADAAMARAWYEKAKAFGSPEASHRLELLAGIR